MIDRVHERLCAWADATAGGFGGGCASQLGALIDNRTAETVKHRRRRVVECLPVRIVDDSGERVVNQAFSHAAEETALGTQSRVAKAATSGVDDVAMDTANAVAKLPADLRDVVHVFYFEGGLAVEVRARKLKMSRMTLYRRLDAAHVILDARLYGSDLPRIV